MTTASSVRYLGVTIDSTLSWNLHVSDVVSKVRSRVASILRFGRLSPVILCSLYTAFVPPLFYYCDVIDVTGYCGHNVNCPFVPRVSSNFGKRSFFYRGTVVE